jgi:hypothetical protein
MNISKFKAGQYLNDHRIGHTTTYASFTGGGRPQVPLCVLFQAKTGTCLDPQTFSKLGG